MTTTYAPTDLRLFHEPADRLRLTAGDTSWPVVVPVWAAPLTRPNRHLSLLDGKGHEIAAVEDPADMDAASRAAVEAELRRRYLTAVIERVDGARVEFGATYWMVTTDRGQREFVTQSLQENAHWIAPNHLLLVDVDGNRFEIRDTAALDAHSRALVASIV